MRKRDLILGEIYAWSMSTHQRHYWRCQPVEVIDLTTKPAQGRTLVTVRFIDHDETLTAQQGRVEVGAVRAIDPARLTETWSDYVAARDRRASATKIAKADLERRVAHWQAHLDSLGIGKPRRGRGKWELTAFYVIPTGHLADLLRTVHERAGTTCSFGSPASGDQLITDLQRFGITESWDRWTDISLTASGVDRLIDLAGLPPVISRTDDEDDDMGSVVDHLGI